MLKLEASYVQKVSAKSGKPYACIEVRFPNGYVKNVFVDFSERYMLDQLSQTQTQVKA